MIVGELKTKILYNSSYNTNKTVIPAHPLQTGVFLRRVKTSISKPGIPEYSHPLSDWVPEPDEIFLLTSGNIQNKSFHRRSIADAASLQLGADYNFTSSVQQNRMDSSFSLS